MSDGKRMTSAMRSQWQTHHLQLLLQLHLFFVVITTCLNGKGRSLTRTKKQEQTPHGGDMRIREWFYGSTEPDEWGGWLSVGLRWFRWGLGVSVTPYHVRQTVFELLIGPVNLTFVCEWAAVKRRENA